MFDWAITLVSSLDTVSLFFSKNPLTSYSTVSEKCFIKKPERCKRYFISNANCMVMLPTCGAKAWLFKMWKFGALIDEFSCPALVGTLGHLQMSK